MNSYEIRYFLKTLQLNVYTGVYAIDQLKYVKATSFAIVVNNMPSSSEGMHWFCLVRKKNQKGVDFFDSLALPIEFYGNELTIFLSQFEGLNYYATRVQSFRSSKCGHHCCFFIAHRFHGLRYINVLKLYTNSVNLNDRMVHNFIKEIDFPKFSQCKTICMKNVFPNVCFQSSKQCCH